MQDYQQYSDFQGNDIVCFANDWDSDPLSKKHIMVRLARHNRILWVNSIGTRNPQPSARDLRRAAGKLKQCFQGTKQVAENIVVLSPIAIPFHGSAWAQRANRLWLSWNLRRACRKLGFRNPITWSFLPSAAPVAGTLGESLVIYHCVDEFSEFTGTNKAALLEMERRLLERSDAVIVSSGPLYDAKRLSNSNTFLVTHGVDLEHFRKACDAATCIPDDLASLPRPVIGFFGLVADWVDLELVRSLALARPEWSFVMIGKCDTTTAAVAGLPNVYLFGKRDYSALPAYCKGFSVAMLPFAHNPLTIAANPLKLREYLAAGLPVVATAIPEAQRLQGLVRVAQSSCDFLEQIEAALRNGAGPRPSISQTMESETWDAKVDQICRIVKRVKDLRTVSTDPLMHARTIPAMWSGSS
jgi:glycosyltransferase involved in cell wall biosynthesis